MVAGDTPFPVRGPLSGILLAALHHVTGGPAIQFARLGTFQRVTPPFTAPVGGVLLLMVKLRHHFAKIPRAVSCFGQSAPASPCSLGVTVPKWLFRQAMAKQCRPDALERGGRRSTGCLQASLERLVPLGSGRDLGDGRGWES